MKIIIVTQTFPLTPTDCTAPFMYDFAQGFSQLGHDVHVFLPFHPKLQTRSFLRLRLIAFKYIWPERLHLLGYGRTLKNDQYLPWYVYIISPLYYFFSIIKLYKTVNKIRPDVLNAHWILPNGFIAATVSWLTGVPLVTSVPGSDAYIARQNILFKLLARIASSRSKKMISNSPLLLRDLELKGPIISYPVPANKGLRVKNPSLVVATAGRDAQKKGFDTLQKVYPDAEIISGLPIDKFRQKLLGVDIFVALSKRDAKGNLDDASLTVLEAMAAGCAVITSDLPGYRLIVDNGKNGLLVNPNRPSEIKRAVLLLKKSRSLREKFGREARKTVSKSLTPQKTAQAYLEVFQTVTPK